MEEQIYSVKPQFKTRWYSVLESDRIYVKQNILIRRNSGHDVFTLENNYAFDSYIW